MPTDRDRAASSPWSDAAIDAALATLAGRPVDRVTVREALDAADTRRRAEADDGTGGPQPRSVEVFVRWGVDRERIPGDGRDWTADPAVLAEMVARAQSTVDDPTRRYDDWRTVTHGPGTPEFAEHLRQTLGDLEASARAAAGDVHRAECDGSLEFADADALADHILECSVCRAEERDRVDAERGDDL